tara:strand:+ start:1017 stop:1217 length:201 start_codon:yes stop_codon:yes gene_type:complete
MTNSDPLKSIKDKPVSNQISYAKMGMEIAFSMARIGQWNKAEKIFCEMHEILFNLQNELEVEEGDA